MRKCRKLTLSRETLRHLDTLRLAAGGATAAATACPAHLTCNARSICVDTCEQFCKGTTVC